MPLKGEKAPGFTLPSTKGEVSLERLLSTSRRVVVVFYAEANTPRCAQVVSALKDEYPTLQELGAEVVGVSADGLHTQKAFENALGGCPFPLASDVHLTASHKYGVIADDKKRSHRAIFVIDTDGTTLHAIPWYQPGNSGQFLEIFEALGMQF